MAFFGITSLGYQDPFRSMLLPPPEEPTREDHHRPPIAAARVPVVTGALSGQAFPLLVRRGPPSPLGISSLSTLPPLCLTPRKRVEPPPYHKRSVEKFTHLKKLCKTPKAPNQMYRQPMTTAQELGWWLPKNPEEDIHTLEPWIHVPRYPAVKSEMTQYVNTMLLTFPDFELF
ncbi:testis-expressed protein 49-like [Callorhinchus milii]|uniref:testis-expressed protein 49-like n=1 Tax=Callorhinchus milii TaxID=7868 RepID=UPI001C3FDACE|nr:testis-expressed protein 49-like [Callorhinchus milii]